MHIGSSSSPVPAPKPGLPGYVACVPSHMLIRNAQQHVLASSGFVRLVRSTSTSYLHTVTAKWAWALQMSERTPGLSAVMAEAPTIPRHGRSYTLEHLHQPEKPPQVTTHRHITLCRVPRGRNSCSRSRTRLYHVARGARRRQGDRVCAFSRLRHIVLPSTSYVDADQRCMGLAPKYLLREQGSSSATRWSARNGTRAGSLDAVCDWVPARECHLESASQPTTTILGEAPR